MQALQTSTDNTRAQQENSTAQILHAEDKFEEKKTKDHFKSSPQNIINLHQNLDQDSAACNSLDCMEGVTAHQEIPDRQNEANKKTKTIMQTPLGDFLRDKFPAFALATASGMHIVAAFGKATEILPKSIENFFNKSSLHVSKLANLFNYSVKGISALAHGRSWDGIGRLAFWIAPFANLENFFLFSGISSGITMMEQGHIDHVKPSSNIFEDFKHNTQAFFTKIKEVATNGISNPFKPNFREKEEKNKRVMFVSAFGNFFGAVLGIISPEKNSALRKVASIVRNLGGIGCDIGKFFHPDMDNRISAAAYGVVSILDVMQTFAPEPFSTILSHLSLATNNLANFYYVNTSKKRDEGSYQQNSAPQVSLPQQQQNIPASDYLLAL